MNKLLVIDGHNYLYRAYYGIPSSAKLKNGLQINAYYGFISFLRRTVEYIKPQNIVVVFDTETGTKKKIIANTSYKQNRNYSDMGMFEQLPIIKQALRYMNIPYIEDSENEGDDVIGSVAYQQSKENEVYVSSQDKDFFQIIDNNLYILRDERRKDATAQRRYNHNIYTREYFEQLWGIPVERYIEYISMKGDPSDNIPGVNGIGRITALKLIKEYENMEKLIEECKRECIKNNKELILNNMEFLKIKKDIELKYSIKEINKERFNTKSNEILKILGYMN